jgi:hypothetical protein
MNAEPDEPDEPDELNIDNAERRTWLLKIPNALHEVGARLGPPRERAFSGWSAAAGVDGRQ